MRKIKRKKIIQTIITVALDLLLVAGAISAVLTIDQGKWVNRFIQNMHAPVQMNGSAPAVIPLTGKYCVSTSQLNGPDALDAFLLLNKYYAGAAPDGSGKRPPVLEICENQR